MAIHSDAGKNEGFPTLNTNILRNKPDMHSFFLYIKEFIMVFYVYISRLMRFRIDSFNREVLIGYQKAKIMNNIIFSILISTPYIL